MKWVQRPIMKPLKKENESKYSCYTKTRRKEPNFFYLLYIFFFAIEEQRKEQGCLSLLENDLLCRRNLQLGIKGKGFVL